jgi:outer membrane protein OmpA-like peptidoglycan-associated protein
MKLSKMHILGLFLLLFGLISVKSMAQEPDEMYSEDSTYQENRAMQIADALQYDGGVVSNIIFNNDKATINQDSSTDIYDIVQILNTDPAMELTVACYTDKAGSPEANKALSQKRAEAVVSAIVDQGIDAGRLTAEGRGNVKMEALENAEDAAFLKNRVEFIVKSPLSDESSEIANADEPFGIKVYPGAQLDKEQTNFARNIMGGDMFCYVTQDDLKKVCTFYEGLGGLESLGSDETSALYMKNMAGSSIRITIGNPWFDSRTGETHSTTMIQILKAE